MAKYLEKSTKKRKLGIIPALIALVLIVSLIWMRWGRNTPGLSNPSGTAGQSPQATAGATSSGPSQEGADSSIMLSGGLKVLHISDYTGMYVEDGTNEIVSGVMMLILENTSDQDLQLARISVAYDDFTAEFEITNLPAGEKLVALEKNRHSAVAQEPQSIEAKNVIFFAEPMDARAEALAFSGGNGLMTVKNISGQDIPYDLYIYYKNSATDLLYGGITYRVVIKGGVAAGETVQAFTGHYAPESSRIISVEYGD